MQSVTFFLIFISFINYCLLQFRDKFMLFVIPVIENWQMACLNHIIAHLKFIVVCIFQISKYLFFKFSGGVPYYCVLGWLGSVLKRKSTLRFKPIFGTLCYFICLLKPFAGADSIHIIFICHILLPW